MTTATARVLAECSLRTAPWPTPAGVCCWCATPLPPRRRRWCSDDCERSFTVNHQWGSTRYAAVKRDGSACVRCGEDGSTLEAWWCLLLACAKRAGRPPGWTDPDYQEAYRLLQRARAAVRLEVNHREPILGRHAEFGCHHHLDGVETLCHRCHVAETARQFGHRTAAPAGPTLFEVAP